MKKIIFAATAALFAIGSTSAMAQTATTPAAKPATTLATPPAAPAAGTVAKAGKKVKAAGTAAKARTEASLKCSADATTNALTGKPRKAFMAACKKSGTDAGLAAAKAAADKPAKPAKAAAAAAKKPN
jgi:hypothetical protein